MTYLMAGFLLRAPMIEPSRLCYGTSTGVQARTGREVCRQSGHPSHC